MQCVLLMCMLSFNTFLLSDIRGYCFGFSDPFSVLCSWIEALFNIQVLLRGSGYNCVNFHINARIFLGRCGMAGKVFHTPLFPYSLGFFGVPPFHHQMTSPDHSPQVEIWWFLQQMYFERHLRWFWILILRLSWVLLSG